MKEQSVLCDSILAGVFPKVNSEPRMVTEKCLWLISESNSKNFSSLILQCIFSLIFSCTFSDSSCGPSLFTVLEGGVTLSSDSRYRVRWKASAHRLPANLRVTNNGLARAWAQSFGQPWKALLRLQEERFFKGRTAGAQVQGQGESRTQPYLCTADPAARGPRARSHSGRRRWGPCSCGSRTCEACWHWTAGSPPAGTASHRVKAKLLALKLPWEHGEDSLPPRALTPLSLWTLTPYQSHPGLQTSKSHGTQQSICTSHFGLEELSLGDRTVGSMRPWG